jgi:short-subunit dehydrogenase involved in D-alanine esterification of teichoic acids
MTAKVRERLSVSKQAPQQFHMERFDLKELSKVEVILNTFAALDNLYDNWGIIRRNIQISNAESPGQC